MCEIMIRSYYFGALTIDQCSNLINKISLHAMCGFDWTSELLGVILKASHPGLLARGIEAFGIYALELQLSLKGASTKLVSMLHGGGASLCP